jgi:hypothetical protein
MSDLKVYSIGEHSFSFAGLPCDSGRGPDEAFSWEQKEPNFTYKAGSDGEGTFSENKVTYCELTLTLMQTSSYNQVLSAILNGDIKIAGGAGIAPLMCRDRQGLTTIAGQARILGPPKQKRGKEVDVNQWVFGVHSPVRLDGGN